MNKIPQSLCQLLLVALLLGLVQPVTVAAETALRETVKALAGNDRTAIRQAVETLSASQDSRALSILEALRDGRLAVNPDGRLLIHNDTTLTDALSGESVPDTGAPLSTPPINNAIRRVLIPAIAQLQLYASDRAVRLAAVNTLAEDLQAEGAPVLRQALAKEQDPEVHAALALALAQLDLNSPDPATQLAAVQLLAKEGGPRIRPLLEQLLAKSEGDEALHKAVSQALATLDLQQFLINQTGNFFYGLSLGSVLLLAALGLAITFGLMGVINMAHGEMLMLGAYATYGVQNLFQAWLPEWFNWYPLAALPAAFLVSAMVGMALERGIIRYLYGRPLETLLATWGISLLLIQTVRLLFGAQNVEVANPNWLSGGVALAPGLVLPYSRLATIAFAVLVLVLVWLLFQRTWLGLQVRAVTQIRPMAACMGINTAQVDMWTFGLGSGVAGLGGVALSQLGNVGPELGQSYIVDCFMVVVLGGVGKLAGTVAGALGLGMVNKFLEPVAGAVLGKIAVLIFIILFIQKRPQGLFALKGRVVES
jgi:urea transport system permease protein